MGSQDFLSQRVKAPSCSSMANYVEETQPDEHLKDRMSHESPCQKCSVATSLGAGAVAKGSGLQCKSCWNLYQILYRHLGGLPESLTQMEPEKQKEFFKTTGEKLLTTPKNGRCPLLLCPLLSFSKLRITKCNNITKNIQTKNRKIQQNNQKHSKKKKTGKS